MTATPADIDSTVVSLDPVVDIRNIGDFTDRMKACIATATAVDMDAESFVSGDVTLIQALVSAAKAAVEQGGSFRIVNAGPALVALFDRCGVDASPLGLAHRQQEG